MSETRTDKVGWWRAVGYALASPAALTRMPLRTFGLFLVYLCLCALVLGLVVVALVAYEGDIRNAALGYVLPESWLFAAEILLEHVFLSQQRVLVVNAVVTAGLMAVTLLLFPVKEMVSASMEEDGELTGIPFEEPPLWEQGWQEIKLFLLFIAVQGVVFALAYIPNPATRAAATTLSYLFLCFSFAIDFIAPIYQRHMGQYSQIIKTLARHPLASLAFGAVFTAPVGAVGLIWEANPTWSWTQALLVLFGVEVISVACAAVCGTWLGAKLYPTFAATGRSHPATRAIAWIVVLGVLAGNTYVFGAVGLSVQRKTQLLECEWSLDPSTIEIDRPGLTDGLGALLSNRVEVGVSAEITVHNPTAFRVEIEPNRVEIRHGGERVAQTALPVMSVDAGETAHQRIAFELAVKPSAVVKGRSLLDAGQWEITLYVAVTDHFELPVYLLRPGDD